jgi:hypothetical protein
MPWPAQDSFPNPKDSVATEMKCSEMFSKHPSHQICVIPSDITWARSAAALGCLFKQHKLRLSTFKNGISFSTLKPKDNKFSTKQFSSAGMSTGSSSSKSFSTSNNPLPADIESKSSNNLAQFFAFNPFLVLTDANLFRSDCTKIIENLTKKSLPDRRSW